MNSVENQLLTHKLNYELLIHKNDTVNTTTGHYICILPCVCVCRRCCSGQKCSFSYVLQRWHSLPEELQHGESINTQSLKGSWFDPTSEVSLHTLDQMCPT